MKNVLLASFLAGLALFLWGFLYYGISGIPYGLLETANPSAGAALKAAFPADGTYILPAPDSASLTEDQQAGPLAMVHLVRDGTENPMGMMLPRFIHGWAYCLLLGILLQQICKKAGYGERVWFVTLVGMAGAFLARFGDAIWWGQAWDWQISNFAYSAVGSAIAGSILAKFIKSPVNAQI
jgi:uncharacterized membrane protein YeaQ/YmgE (transglycosylase-associated protein family)